MSEIIQRRFSEGPAGYDKVALHPVGRYKLADMIGLKFNLSGSAVMKYGLYASALESIRKQDSFIFDRIISGEVRISHENTLDISNLRGDDMRILRECFSDFFIYKLDIFSLMPKLVHFCLIYHYIVPNR